MYVPNSALFSGSAYISIIKIATNKVVGAVSVGLDPQRIAFVPDGSLAYVANQLSNNVSVINTAMNTVIATLPVGIGPVAVAITPWVK